MPQLDCQTAIILSLLLSLSIVHCSTVDTSRDAEKGKLSKIKFFEIFENTELLTEWLNWDNLLGEDDFALYHPPIPEMKGLSCFQCSPKDHHMNCDLIRDPSSFEDFLEHNPDFLEEMKMAKKVDGTWTWENSMAQKFHEAEHPNPCKLITNKVLELVESSEDAIPIYLDAGKGGWW